VSNRAPDEPSRKLTGGVNERKQRKPEETEESRAAQTSVVIPVSVRRIAETEGNASTETSRRQSQDSGSRWSSLSPFLWGSFIPYNTPV
jgi:hypothetical protein